MQSTRRRRVAADTAGTSKENEYLNVLSTPPAPSSSSEDKETSLYVSNRVEVSFWIKSFLILFVCAVYVCTTRNTCTYSSQHETSKITRFSSDNARLHLQRITSLGPRPAGSYANEVSAADYLRRELLGIVDLAKTSGMQAEFDEQISNYSSFQAGFHVSAYNNVRNFLLKIHGTTSSQGNNSRRAFLINCHFDSAVESPGASDDFVSCAVMLEASRIIALGRSNLTNDLIFLFNGAEESILLSSHAFITQHPWAKEVVAFLNLEGAGSGGRLMVFQSGPGSDAEFLVNTYSDSFEQPYANVFAEELFQSGFIPSDTDFRIFRDFGHIPGLDMAYTSDGYSYHTRYDTESRISTACLQTTGDDILAFLHRIGRDEVLGSISKLETQAEFRHMHNSLNRSLSSDDIDRSYRPTSRVKTSVWNRRVYFDILGMQLVSVPWKLWKLFDWIFLLAFVSWLLYDKRLNCDRWIGFTLALTLQFFGQMFGAIFAYTLGYVTHHYGCRMSWYSAHYNLIGIYLLPFICWFFWFFSLITEVPRGLGTCFSNFQKLFHKIEWLISRKKNHSRIERDFFDSGIAIIALHMLIFDLLNSPAAFVSTIWLAFVLSGRIVYQMFSIPLNSIRWTLFIILPTCLVCHFYFCSSVIDFFIPIFGRSGQVINPDIALSLCLFYLISPLTLLFSGMIQCSTRNTAKTLRLVLLNACISYAVLVHASPYGFPYTVPPVSAIDDPSLSPRFQRVALFHTERYFRDIADSEEVTSNDSFVSVIPLDVNDIRYLKPHSYPVSIPSSIFTVLQRDDAASSDHFSGLEELVNASPVPCNRSRPYCGTASLYPYIHFLQSFYEISSHPHLSKPSACLNMLSRTAVNYSSLQPDRRGVNLTFSIVSGPPHTHLLIRTDTPLVRLSNWSFSSASTVPIPVPLPSKNNFHGSTGAHYFVYYVNAEVLSASQKWTKPWIFWLTLDFSNDAVNPHIDLAVTGIYVHEKFTSCNSPRLKEVASRLPPWVTTMSGCSSYEHYRFRLN